MNILSNRSAGRAIPLASGRFPADLRFSTNRYGLSLSNDLIHWDVNGDVSFPEDACNGSFLAIQEDELAALLWRFDFRFLVEQRSLTHYGSSTFLGEES
jgi:hypothetical protein